jgi:PAS domain S-box-containing protein
LTIPIKIEYNFAYHFKNFVSSYFRGFVIGFYGTGLSKLAPVVFFKALEDCLMAEKPSYEALEQRVNKLEKEALGPRQADRVSKLTEHEEKAILDSLLEHVVYQDTKHRILWANQAACNSAGMTRDGVIGRCCYDVWAGRESPCEDCPVAKARQTGKPETVEKMTPDGRWWYIQGYPVRDDRGHIMGVTELTLDITDRKKAEVALRAARDGLQQRVEERTSELLSRNEQLKLENKERKRAEEALRDSEKTLKAIVAASPVGIGLMQDRIIKWGNRALYNMLGYEEGALEDIGIEMIYTNRDEYKRVGRDLYPVIEAKGIGHVETKWVAKDGAVLDCYLQLTALDRSDLSEGVIVAAMDITHRKQAEDQIRALSHQLLQAQELERQRLAYDLHDHLAQDLSALKIAFDTFCDQHPEISTGARQRVADFSKGLGGVILAVRDLAYDLRPPGLDEAGLVDALDEYCQEYSSQNDLEIEFLPVGVDEAALNLDTKITLYRLVQEALSNVRKHADANRTFIRLVPSFPNIILRVEDDGIGFDVAARLAAAHYEKRLGLLGMKERVALLGGTMEIQSRPGQGTKIFIELPCGGKYHDKEEDHANR